MTAELVPITPVSGTSLVALSAFEARYGRAMVGAEITTTSAALVDASELALEVADLTTEWTSATVPATVVSVICSMVRRAFDNPNGLQGESIGDYTWRGAKSEETATVYMTADERRTVRKAAAKLGITSINLTSDLPYGPVDPRISSGLVSLEGVTIVNQAEPED